jgi:hypothetical protein
MTLQVLGAAEGCFGKKNGRKNIGNMNYKA